jgi:tRNA(Ile)-lysidine synthase
LGLEAGFSRALDRLELRLPFALAVSGGGDSSALLHLTSEWAAARGVAPQSITVLTVDHGLRPEAAEECARVAAWADQLGMRCVVLRWRGERPVAGVQEKARLARRHLLAGWCRDHGRADLLLAHTSDDQQETVGMRLMRGSGTRGLAGMATESEGPFGVRFCRPLLSQAGGALRDWLAQQGHPWIEDPSNQDRSFERVRVREALATFPGLAPALDVLGEAASVARSAMDAAVRQLIEDAVRVRPGAWAEIDLSVFRSAPEALGRQALSQLVTGLGGAAYPPGRSALDRLMTDLLSLSPRARTLGGSHLVPKARDLALLGREARNISALDLTPRKWTLWDHRLEVWCAVPARARPFADLDLGAFSPEDRARIKAAVPGPYRGALLVLETGEGHPLVPQVVPPAGLVAQVRFRGVRGHTGS